MSNMSNRLCSRVMIDPGYTMYRNPSFRPYLRSGSFVMAGALFDFVLTGSFIRQIKGRHAETWISIYSNPRHTVFHHGMLLLPDAFLRLVGNIILLLRSLFHSCVTDIQKQRYSLSLFYLLRTTGSISNPSVRIHDGHRLLKLQQRDNIIPRDDFSWEQRLVDPKQVLWWPEKWKW